MPKKLEGSCRCGAITLCLILAAELVGQASSSQSFSPKAGNSSDRILCRANSNFADSSSSTAFQTPRFIVLNLAIPIIMT